jgi:hypothetical protein
MMRSNQLLMATAAVAFLFLSVAPCQAGPIAVTLSGNWASTGTSLSTTLGSTPANTVAPFSISFEVDQNPDLDHVGATGFTFAVPTMTFVNGSIHTLNGRLSYGEDATDGPYFDFRLFGIAADDYLQVVGGLPSLGYSGLVSDPTLLQMNDTVESLMAFYYPVRTVGSSTRIIGTGTYVAVLGDVGAGSVPEPATMGVMVLALFGLASLKLRRRP